MSLTKLLQKSTAPRRTPSRVYRACIGLVVQTLLSTIALGCANTYPSTTYQGAALSYRTQEQQEATALTVGTQIRREIVGTEVHTYLVNQSLRAVIEANVDLIIVVVKPDGKAENHALSPGAESGSRLILLLAEPAGGYRLEVRSISGSRRGQYRLIAEQATADALISPKQPHELRRDEEVYAQREKKQLRTKLSEITTRTLEEGAKPLSDQTGQLEDASSQSN
jgi:hypothetical protein